MGLALSQILNISLKHDPSRIPRQHLPLRRKIRQRHPKSIQTNPRHGHRHQILKMPQAITATRRFSKQPRHEPKSLHLWRNGLRVREHSLRRGCIRHVKTQKCKPNANKSILRTSRPLLPSLHTHLLMIIYQFLLYNISPKQNPPQTWKEEYQQNC